MAIANPKFVKAEVFDPAFYADKKTTNVTITEALQALSGAIQTLKGTKVAKEVNINESKSIIVDQYAIIVNTQLDIDEVQTIFSALQTYKDESGYFIQEGGYIELTASEDKHITLKHSTAIGGVKLLTAQDKILTATPILIMKNGDFWEEQVSPSRIATDEEIAEGLKEDVAINPKHLATKANLDLGNVSELLSENFTDKILGFLVEAPELNASLECVTFSSSTNWIAPSSGIAIAICIHGGGGGGAGGRWSVAGAHGGGGGGMFSGSGGLGGDASKHYYSVGGVGGFGGNNGTNSFSGGGGGGGSGTTSIAFIDVIKDEEITITVGAGGVGGSVTMHANNPGGVGGVSTVGSNKQLHTKLLYMPPYGVGGTGGTAAYTGGSAGMRGNAGAVLIVYINK